MVKLPTAQQFWQFSVAVYGTDNVKQHCLYWQDLHGLNVNLLLLCIWLDSNHYRLSRSGLQSLEGAVKDSAQQLSLMRQQRNALQKGSDGYHAHLQSELKAEAGQQATLLLALNQLMTLEQIQQKTVPLADRGIALSTTVSGIYLSLCGISLKSSQAIEFEEVLNKNKYFIKQSRDARKNLST